MLHQLHMAGIIPVIKIDKAQDAVPVCRALADGGLPVAEITFRTEAAVEAIQLVKQQVPDVLLGAGTVLTTAQVDAAIQAGAAFIVSPGFNKKVVLHCLDNGISVLPGCASPTEIEMALGGAGGQVLPGGGAGRDDHDQSPTGPHPQLRFAPGSVNEQNLLDYLIIHLCRLRQQLDGAAGGRGRIGRRLPAWRARRWTDAGDGLRHIGINHKDADQADQTAWAGPVDGLRTHP